MTSFSLGQNIRPQRASRSLQRSGPRTTPKFAATGVEKSFPRVYAVAKESSASSSQSVEAAASVLREAATDPSIPPPKVFRAMRDLEEAKLPTEGWPEILGGTSSPGRRWRLVFTSGTKEVQVRSRFELCVLFGFVLWHFHHLILCFFSLLYRFVLSLYVALCCRLYVRVRVCGTKGGMMAPVQMSTALSRASVLSHPRNGYDTEMAYCAHCRKLCVVLAKEVANIFRSQRHSAGMPPPIP